MAVRALADPFNSRLAIQVREDGRFNMGAFPNATGGSGPNSWDLLFRWPSAPGTSYTTFRIDGSDQRYGSTGTQVEAPTDIDSKTNRSRWRMGDIEVTQVLQLAFNNQTGQEDVARISYTARNTGSVQHAVGTRVMLDTEINNNDGAVFRIPGVGLVTKETNFFGSGVPDTFQSFASVTDNTHVAASTLKSGGATAPDRLVLARWRGLFDSPFDYVIDPTFDFKDRDSAYALFWNPITLAPGASQTFTTLYGLAQLNVDLSPPLALGVTGPAALTCTAGRYDPNPFTVTGTVLNNGTATATGVQATLNLPSGSGLALASGSATQVVGDVPVGTERQVTWTVQAAPRSGGVSVAYSVTATATNAPAKTVQRGIELPACGGPVNTAPAFTADSPPTTATVGTPYSAYTFAATGVPKPTFAKASGNLPDGLTLDSVSGILSGTPTKAGSFTFTVSASNGVSPDAISRSIVITVSNPASTAGRYVALGDSFSAGEGNPPFVAGTDTATNKCHRSDKAYGPLLQDDLGIPDGPNFVFRACSGAILADFVAQLDGPGQWGEGSQLDAIAQSSPDGTFTPSLDTSLVTFSIGGNDFGFPGAIQDCVLSTPLSVLNPRFAAVARLCSSSVARNAAKGAALLTSGGRILVNTVDGTWERCGNVPNNLDICQGQRLDSKVVTVPKLSDVYRMVHARAPNAKIRVLLYPHLFANNPPLVCPQAGLFSWNMTLINGITDSVVNRTIVDAVRDVQRRNPDIDITTVTTNGLFQQFGLGHGLCDTGTSWINGLTPPPDVEYSFHPNEFGQRAFRTAVKASL